MTNTQPGWLIYPAAVATGVILGLAGTWFARTIACRLRIVSDPNPIVPQHTKPVPYLGGVGVALGSLLSQALMNRVASEKPDAAPGLPAGPYLVGSLAFLIVGLLDDLHPLSAGRKLVLQFALAILAAALGLTVPLTGSAFGDGALAVLWVVLLVNAVNMTDVCDGLVGGLAAIAFLFLAAWSPELRIVCLATSGACLGFLFFNRPPARIFLGDAGSHFLGFALAAKTITLVARDPAWPTVAAMPIVLMVPLSEFAFLVAVRMGKGLRPWKGSPDHSALRLQRAGLTAGWTVGVLCSAGVGAGLAAMALRQLTLVGQVAVLAAVTAMALTGARIVLRFPVEPRRPAIESRGWDGHPPSV